MKLNVAPNACRPIPRKSPPQTAYKRSKICKVKRHLENVRKYIKVYDEREDLISRFR